MNMNDIDALADTIRACFTRAQSLGPTDMSDGHRSLEGLVAIAKEAERERDDARRLADDITYTKGHVAFLRDRVAEREARVAALEANILRWRESLSDGWSWMSIDTEMTSALHASPDTKEGTA